MKAFLPLKVVASSLTSLFVQFAPLTLFAETTVPEPQSYTGGLQVSLVTSGYKFLVPPAPTVNVVPQPVPLREFFSASVLLYNRSNSDIKFTFPDANAAAHHFAFRVFDEDGALIWESEAPSLIPVQDTAVNLNRHRSWRRSIQVPLKVNDTTWLSPGRYTLEAVVNGRPQLGATTIFQVALRDVPPPPRTDTGIEGVVYQRSSFPTTGDGPTVEPWPVKAILLIEEIISPTADPTRAPFVWNGTTDDQGKFHVVTPPGRFRVTAARAPQPFDPTRPTEAATIEVTVIAGSFTGVAIYLPPGPFYPPPRADTGIRGLVKAPVGGPAAAQPLAGAPVLVEEISQPSIRPRFRWTGTTNSEGRFQVATFPDSYRVTARQLTSTGIELGSATAEVTVQEGKFSDLELLINNAMVGPMVK